MDYKTLKYGDIVQFRSLALKCIGVVNCATGNDMIVVFYLEADDTYYYNYVYWLETGFKVSRFEMNPDSITIFHNSMEPVSIYRDPTLNNNTENEFFLKVEEIYNAHIFDKEFLNAK